MKQKHNYIDKNAFLSALRAYLDGTDRDQFVRMAYCLVDHILGSRQYQVFPLEDRKDWRQIAVLRVLRAAEKFNFEKSENFFGFSTRTVQNSIGDQIRKYYRLVNNWKKFVKLETGMTDQEFERFSLRQAAWRSRQEGWCEDDD